MFELHHRLKEDCIEVGRFPLCLILMLNDANYPWFILVPRRESVEEIFELSDDDQLQLLKESSYLSKKLSAAFDADKMNVATLGNMVPQLHMHHIVRYKDDAAWPKPVWGQLPAVSYHDDEIVKLLSKVGKILTDNFESSVGVFQVTYNDVIGK